MDLYTLLMVRDNEAGWDQKPDLGRKVVWSVQRSTMSDGGESA